MFSCHLCNECICYVDSAITNHLFFCYLMISSCWLAFILKSFVECSGGCNPVWRNLRSSCDWLEGWWVGFWVVPVSLCCLDVFNCQDWCLIVVHYMYYITMYIAVRGNAGCSRWRRIAYLRGHIVLRSSMRACLMVFGALYCLDVTQVGHWCLYIEKRVLYCIFFDTHSFIFYYVLIYFLNYVIYFFW